MSLPFQSTTPLIPVKEKVCLFFGPHWPNKEGTVSKSPRSFEIGPFIFNPTLHSFRLKRLLRAAGYVIPDNDARLEARRGRRGLTEFTREITEIDRETIRLRVKGRASLTAHVAAVIAANLGCSPGWLLYGDGCCQDRIKEAEDAAYQRAIRLFNSVNAADAAGE